MIDAGITLGEGQCMGIFAAAGVGKSTRLIRASVPKGPPGHRRQHHET